MVLLDHAHAQVAAPASGADLQDTECVVVRDACTAADGIDALGERRWTRIAMSGTAVVLGLSLLAQSPWLFMIGCAVTGFGVATLFPAAMRAAAHVPGIRPATGVATISWLSRAGFVTAPLIVGVIAENFSLGWGISVTVVAALILLPLSSILTWERSR